jgi:hypothetical protein
MSTVISDRKGKSIVRIRGFKDVNGGKAVALAGRIVRFKSAAGASAEASLKAVLSRINGSLTPPAGMGELMTAIESSVVGEALRHRIGEMRDPKGYFSRAAGA